MKKAYLEAEIQIVDFETEDIISTSDKLDEDELPLIPAG